jgi:hypothetical protein
MRSAAMSNLGKSSQAFGLSKGGQLRVLTS